MKFGMSREGDIILMPKYYPQWHAINEWARGFLAGERSVIINEPGSCDAEELYVQQSPLSVETENALLADAVAWINAACKHDPKLMKPSWVDGYHHEAAAEEETDPKEEDRTDQFEGMMTLVPAELDSLVFGEEAWLRVSIGNSDDTMDTMCVRDKLIVRQGDGPHSMKFLVSPGDVLVKRPAPVPSNQPHVTSIPTGPRLVGTPIGFMSRGDQVWVRTMFVAPQFNGQEFRWIVRYAGINSITELIVDSEDARVIQHD